MFATDELVNHRKAEAKRLQKKLDANIIKVSKIILSKIRSESLDVSMNYTSYGSGVNITFKDINATTENSSVILKHYDWMDFDYDNCVCEFYKEQIKITEVWIEMLK